MAGKATNKVANQVSTESESSQAADELETLAAEPNQPASDLFPEPHITVRVRADKEVVVGHRLILTAGREITSQQYDLQALMRQGVKLDVLDDENGEVLGPLDLS